MKDEPLLWSSFFAARGRALAASQLTGRDEALTIELTRLTDEAERLGFRADICAIQQALEA